MNSIYRTAVKGLRELTHRWEPATSLPLRIGRTPEPDWTSKSTVLLDPINSIYAAIRGLLVGREEGVVVHIVSITPGEGASSVARSLAQKAETLSNLNVFMMDGNDTGQGSAFWSIKRSASYLRDNAVAKPSLTDPIGVEAAYAACRQEYPLTIVDCPSIYSGRFFETMPKLSDGIILVIQAEKLPAVLVRQAVDLVKQQGVEVLGVVLNKTRHYIPSFLNKLI